MKTLGKKIHLFGFDFWPIDALIMAAFLYNILLLLIFHASIPGWLPAVLKVIAMAIIFVIVILAAQKVKHELSCFLLRLALVQFSFGLLFTITHPLQQIVFLNWQDQLVLNLEQAIFGVQPTLWLEHLITPWLTEWMMFAYVIYLPLYPILGAIVYYKNGRQHLEQFFLLLGITNICCNIGFILFPVASPLHFIPKSYSVPLKGYLFSYFGELIRTYTHPVGGSIPSAHCAIATVMLITAYRYHRPTFYILIPVIVSLYISTFYCRYHYLTDSVVGIAAAILMLFVLAPITRAWNSATVNLQPSVH